MAFTRKFLSALGIDSEKAEEIIQAHVETVNALKEEIDKYKTDSANLAEVTKERDKYKGIAETANSDGFEDKYNTLKADFDKYKSEIQERETMRLKEKAYRNLLKESGISEKRLDSVLKVSNLSGIEFDNDGKIQNHDELINNIKSEWSDFIVTETKSGADVPHPPTNTAISPFEGLPLDKKMIFANEHPNDESVKAWLAK